MPKRKFWQLNELDQENSLVEYKTKSSISDKVFIKLLNVQCLTQQKMIEIEDHMNLSCDNSIICLIETHQKRKTIKISDGIDSLHKMRDVSDKKGGGILTIWRKSQSIKIDMIKSSSPDFMICTVSINQISFILLVIYAATNDVSRNDVLYKEIFSFMMKYEDEKMLIIGDFNGHIGLLGKQKIDKNGRRVLDLADRFNLSILNLDDKCVGDITWSQRGMESVIDFALINQTLYKEFVSMFIDEQGEILNISDHNMIQIELKCNRSNNTFSDNKKISFNSKSEKAIGNYINCVRNHLSQCDPLLEIDKLNDIIREAEKSCLSVTIKKKISNEKTEAVWITKEIKKEISKKRVINKLRRKEKDENQFAILNSQFKKTENYCT